MEDSLKRSLGEEGEAGKGSLQGLAGRLDLVRRPPSTNRGSVVPEVEGVSFRPHWFRFTVFKGLQEVLSFVEANLIEPGGLPFDWIEKGPASRWQNILHHAFGGGGVFVLQYPVKSPIEYTVVEVRGAGCDVVGAEGLGRLIEGLEGSGWRWHTKRIDLAWDGVPFTPEQFDEAVRAGQFVSRSMSSADRGWRNNAEGSTAYLPDVEKRKGRNRLVRVYDRRGPVRCELELHDEDAQACVLALAGKPVQLWSRVASGYLLRTVDFRACAEGQRSNRCARLPWWESFVGDAEKVKILGLPEAMPDHSITSVGMSEVAIQRCARRMFSIAEAHGWAYLCERIEHYGRPKQRDEDRAFTQDLKRYRGSGLAGIPDDLPF